MYVYVFRKLKKPLLYFYVIFYLTFSNYCEPRLMPLNSLWACNSHVRLLATFGWARKRYISLCMFKIQVVVRSLAFVNKAVMTVQSLKPMCIYL